MRRWRTLTFIFTISAFGGIFLFLDAPCFFNVSKRYGKNARKILHECRVFNNGRG